MQSSETQTCREQETLKHHHRSTFVPHFHDQQHYYTAMALFYYSQLFLLTNMIHGF